MRIGGAIAIVVAMLVAFFWVQGKGREALETANRQLKESREELSIFRDQNGRLSNLVAQARLDSSTNASLSELLTLRGEVGLLRREMDSLRNTQKVAEIWGFAGADRNIKLAQAEAILKTVQAEAAGDTGRVIAIQMELADFRMNNAENAHSLGKMSKEEFATIKREVAEITHGLRLQRLEVAKVNQDWSAFDSIGAKARAEAHLAELNLNLGASDESEVAWRKAKLEEIEAVMRRLNSEAGRPSLK